MMMQTKRRLNSRGAWPSERKKRMRRERRETRMRMIVSTICPILWLSLRDGDQKAGMVYTAYRVCLFVGYFRII